MSNNEYVRNRAQAFQQAILSDRLSGKFDNYSIAVKYLSEIIDSMMLSYDNYRESVSRVLHILEWLKENLLPYAMPLVEDYCKMVLNSVDIKDEDLSIVDEIIDDGISQVFMDVLGKTLSKDNKVEMAGFELDLDGISELQKRKMLALVIAFLEHNTEKVEWDQETVETMFLNISAGRRLAKELGQLDILYYSTGMLLDRLFVSGRQQYARDISENILLCSFIDGMPEWGFFMEFRAFSAQGDISASILYSLLYMSVVIKKGFVQELLLKETAWQFVKFYRNINMTDLALDFYSQIPKRVKFGAYKTRALKQTMFSSMLLKHDKGLPNQVLEYLHLVREDVFRGGMHDCLPWLVLLYNIRKMYSDADFSMTGLGFYIKTFEAIVPEAMVAPFKKILVDSQDNPDILIDDLKTAIMKLAEARSLSDFSYDNEAALKLAQKVVMGKNIEGFLISMMVKSDFGLFFHEKAFVNKEKLSFANSNSDMFYQYYKNYLSIDKNHELQKVDIVWLAVGEEFVRQCTLFENVFNIDELEEWKGNGFGKIKDQLKPFLIHEITKKVRGQVQMLVEEDYEYQIENIKKLVFSMRIVEHASNALFVIKDMALSDFPHNLLLNMKGEFISLSKPIANVLSTDRLLESLVINSVERDFSKSIWVPVEAGDIAINRLSNQIEDTLKLLEFNLFTSASLALPLASDLNVLVCHGADDISKFNVIYPGGEASIFDIESVIGNGQILILFVCYSGSMDKDYFQNQIATIIKRFLDLGYKSIIAPFWALSIDVPPIWLPVFMGELASGRMIVDCVWKANMAVKEQYLNSTPATWACLHLYGNPFLKVS